ncbi:MAG: HD-GYP domain-containing protein, partial [Thermomicrobiales bacterium]
ALDMVVPFVRHHHERWDGAGYPLGLAAETIPLGARILAICDAYDTMVGDRPYRRGLGHDEAILRLLASAGTQFDPALVDQFVALPLDDLGLAPDEQRAVARLVSEGVAG